MKKEEYKALTDRIEHFERINRRDMDALNMLLEMNNIYSKNGEIRNRQIVFSSLRENISRLINFDVVSFFLVDEEDSSFILADCSEEIEVANILELKDNLVDNGEFSWALNQNRTVIVEHTDNDNYWGDGGDRKGLTVRYVARP